MNRSGPGAKRGGMRSCRSILLVGAGLAVLAAGACETRRVVRGSPMLGSLPGAEVGAAIRPTEGVAKDRRTVVVDESEASLRVEHPDGSVTLIARTGRQLMSHIFTTLDQNEGELFVDQVLSEMTKREFAQQGVDPMEGFKYLKQHERAIRKLFNTIPMGEYTPGTFMKPQGENVFRLEAPKLLHRTLAWTFMDMVYENGHWRLRWFG